MGSALPTLLALTCLLALAQQGASSSSLPRQSRKLAQDGGPVLDPALFTSLPTSTSRLNTVFDRAIDNLASWWRVVGGTTAQQNRYTWLVSLRDGNGNHFCGGSLIAPEVVLTAAHCVNQTIDALKHPTIQIGRYSTRGTNENFETLKCQFSIAHPGWSFTTTRNDLALCFLDRPSQFQPVTLAKASTSFNGVTPLNIAGWGSTVDGGSNAQYLQRATVYLQDPTQCNRTYSGRIRETMFCAGLPQGGVDACQGDSGGPIFLEGANAAQDVQLGIVSFGTGCAQAGKPGVYTDVRQYRDWIYKIVQERGVNYQPLSPNFNSRGADAPTQGGTPPPPPTVEDPCACTSDGKSGNVTNVPSGCAQHGLAAHGDTFFYCYVVQPDKCSSATASNVFLGAAWRDCGTRSTSSTNVLQRLIQAFTEAGYASLRSQG